ncbi:hypothetical protein ACJX0J_025250, partial [Zea mays]
LPTLGVGLCLGYLYLRSKGYEGAEAVFSVFAEFTISIFCTAYCCQTCWTYDDKTFVIFVLSTLGVGLCLGYLYLRSKGYEGFAELFIVSVSFPITRVCGSTAYCCQTCWTYDDKTF